jgi:hypothetical protein
VTDLDRGIVSWSGSGVVGGGVSVFYATPGGSFMSLLHTFFDNLKGNFPNVVTFQFPSSGDTIDSATGHLVGGWTGTTLTNVTGTSSQPFSGLSGCCVNWLTNTIVPAHGGKPPRKLRGRTFLVPLANVDYDTDGTLAAALLTQLATETNTLISGGAGHFQVWHRPTTPGATDGVAGPVVSARFKDHAAVLHSRAV